MPYERSPRQLPPRRLPGPDDILREIYRRDFYRFVKDFWHIVEPAEPLVDTELMRVLCLHAQKFVEAMVADLNKQPWGSGFMQDFGVEVPPGSSKSMLFAVFLPAWAWGAHQAPWLRWIFSTYEHNLTLRDSRRRRDILKDADFQRLWGHLVVFKKDTDQQGYYANTRGGFCLSTSVGGAGTGHRAHCFVGDDLMNAQEAHSDTAYEKIVEHLNAMSSRGVRQSAYRRLMIGQRLGERDPGAWAREKGFEVLKLSTEFDPDKVASTRIWRDSRTTRGELLNPQRMGPEAVAKAKLDLGPYAFSAQHNQEPVPVGGGVIKIGWLQQRSALPLSSYGALFSFWDTAFTDDEDNDQSARVLLGLRPDGLGVDIVHAWPHRLQVHALQEEVIRDSNEWRPTIVAVEEKASGIVLVQNLRDSPRFPFHLHPIKIPSGFGKDARAHAATPFVARGLVGIDWGQPWAEAFRKQLEVFPKGKTRDIADAFVHGVLYVQEHYRFEHASLIATEPDPATKAPGPREDKPQPAQPFNTPPVEPVHDYTEGFGSSDYDAI